MYALISSYFSKFAVFTVIFFFFPHTPIQGNSNAKENILTKINILHNGLKKMHSNQTNNKKLQNILGIINQTYDTHKMIRIIVGRKWNDLERKEQKKLVDTFRKYISHNYLKKFKKINKFNFEYVGIDQLSKKYKICKTLMIIPDENQLELNYLFHKKNGDWKIFDVLLNGTISEIAIKRSEFKKIIEEGGIKLLIKEMEKRINSGH